MEVESAEVAGDVDGFADYEEPGDGAGFHGAGVEVIGVDAAGGDFRLFEALRAYGVELPAAESALGGFEGGVGPAVGGGNLGKVMGKTLGKDGAERLRKGGVVTAGAGVEERLEHLGVGRETGREVDVQGFAGTPVGRCLEDGGAAEAPVREEHFFAKARSGAGGR